MRFFLKSISFLSFFILASCALPTEQYHWKKILECEEKILRYELMPKEKREAYLKRSHYLLHLPDSLLFYGAQHSDDVRNPQFKAIEEHWKRFSPTFAFHENQETGIGKDRKYAIQQYREAGLLRFLASRDNVPFRFAEPTSSEKVGWLKWKFEAKKVELFFILRTAQHQRDRFGKGPQQIKEFFRKTFYPLLEKRSVSFELDSWEKVQAEYSKYWPIPRWWWQAPGEWFDPIKRGSETGGQFTNAINAEESWFRNRLLFQYVGKKLMEGERVFVVYGAPHIPVLEPAFRCLEAHL